MKALGTGLYRQRASYFGRPPVLGARWTITEHWHACWLIDGTPFASPAVYDGVLLYIDEVGRIEQSGGSSTCKIGWNIGRRWNLILMLRPNRCPCHRLKLASAEM